MTALRFAHHPERGILANGRPLRKTAEAHRASPTGMTFGYAGSGCYAAAHSMLAHLFGIKTADQYAMQFKFDVVAKLQPSFILHYSHVREWLREQQAIRSGAAGEKE